MMLLSLASSVIVLLLNSSSVRSDAFFGTRPFGLLQKQHSNVLPLRGGYSAGGSSRDDDQNEYNDDDDGLPPRINAEVMSLALRWTGEVNRRLGAVTRPREDPLASPLTPTRETLVGGAPMVRGGGETMMMESPASSSSPSSSFMDPQLTLFHATSPQPTGFGTDRWGPNLESYIAYICRRLNLPEESSAELSLALMYLDRACSADTPRSNGVLACPFLQPRTAHRLVLSALLLAAQSLHGWPLPVLMERVEGLGGVADSEQLAQMVQWMQGALGDPGYFVTQQQIQTWRNLLRETARLRPPPPQQRHDHPASTTAILEEDVTSNVAASSAECNEVGGGTGGAQTEILEQPSTDPSPVGVQAS